MPHLASHLTVDLDGDLGGDGHQHMLLVEGIRKNHLTGYCKWSTTTDKIRNLLIHSIVFSICTRVKSLSISQKKM